MAFSLVFFLFCNLCCSWISHWSKYLDKWYGWKITFQNSTLEGKVGEYSKVEKRVTKFKYLKIVFYHLKTTKNVIFVYREEKLLQKKFKRHVKSFFSTKKTFSLKNYFFFLYFCGSLFEMTSIMDETSISEEI